MKSRMIKCVGHAARMGKKRNTYRLLVGNPEGKRSLGKPRRRWVDGISKCICYWWEGQKEIGQQGEKKNVGWMNSIKTDLGEIGWFGQD
jgi:hypothetical protein